MGLVLNAVVAAIAVVVAACLATHEGSVSVARAVNASQGGRKVVVVGGGIGGLVAAHRLRQQGVDVTILEARYKMGGRVWTHRGWGGHPIDVGATFIHGVEGNPLTALAEEFKQPVVKVDYSKMKVYGSGGARIGADAIRTTKELYRLLRKQVMRTRDSLYKDIPLQESFEKAYAKVTAPSGSGEPSSRLLRGKDEVEAMSWHFFWEVVQDQIAELRALSTVEFDASTAFAGHDYVMGNGMQSLTDAVASAATAAGVAAHVNCTVVQVAHTGSSYMVACADKRSFEADEVVVALPLGVMQKGSVAFDPPLPKWKRRSIHRLGCSAAVKMALHFPSAFWDSDAQFIGKVSATNQTMWGDGAHMEFINMNAFHSGSNVLVLEVDVEHAKAVNAMAWEERVAHVMRALRTIYGEAIPEPDDVKMANFVGDPLVGCGFSYWPPFVSGDDNLEAAESVHGNTLHFIGEYTSPLYYGNLHGAVDEAEKLAQRFASRSMADVFSAVVAPVAAVFSPPSTRGHGKVKKRFVPQWCPAPCQSRHGLHVAQRHMASVERFEYNSPVRDAGPVHYETYSSPAASSVRKYRRRDSPRRATSWGPDDGGDAMHSWIASGSHEAGTPLRSHHDGPSPSPVASPLRVTPVASMRRENGVGVLTLNELGKMEKQAQCADWARYNDEYNSPKREAHRRCTSCGAKKEVPHGPRKPDGKHVRTLRSELVHDWVETSSGAVPRGGRKVYLPHAQWPDGSTGGIVEVPIPHPRALLHPDSVERELWPGWRKTHVVEGPPHPEEWRRHAANAR